ncbi:MAG: choice-of-anchor B family protein [Bacteroidota bacterium]|nr:choice-of-anchor B family protein [Bacteroidota bacterium]
MKNCVLLLLVLLPGIAAAQYAPQYGAAVAMTADYLMVGEGRNLLLPGTVHVYGRGMDGWERARQLTPGGDIARGFGRALAADGNRLVIGAPLTDEVFVYALTDSPDWTLQAVLTGESEGFGSTVAISGNHILVSSPGSSELPGSVEAFHQTDEGTWQSLGMLEAAGIETGDGFGAALALSPEHAVVGAPSTSLRAGALHEFKFDGNRWTYVGPVSAGESAAGDRFGTSVVLTDNGLAVSAPGRSNGIVFVLNRGAESWKIMRTLVSGDPGNFGEALAYSSDRLWIGAPDADGRSGSLYLVKGDGDLVSARPEDLQFRSLFGSSIAAYESNALIGATGHDNFEGAVYYAVSDAISGSDDPTPMFLPAFFNPNSDLASITGEQIDCRDGAAGMFPCSEVDMISFMTRQEIGAKRGIQVNDVWGWEDAATGREYALVGRTDGTSFIDLSDPSNPRYLGDLPKTATANQSLWRDIKVYKDHAFIVADGAGAHHMQVFDLTQLRDVTEPRVFEETALYKGVYSSHNIVINEESGYAYAVGNDSGGETCGGALHMINIQDPTHPTFAGCFADTRTGRRNSGATHDAQCVTYRGPDAEFVGREICLSSNGTALSIADVTDKANPVALSIAEYPNVAYTHQGWLTEDHRYFYLNDEGDEVSEVVPATRTLIFDVSDLEDPQLVKEYMGPTSAIDHNLYIRGDMMYQTNYLEGLRLVDISDPENPVEVGHFDTVPYGPNDNSPVLGAWSNYPYFKSGVIVVTSGREGVFFLKKRPVDT